MKKIILKKTALKMYFFNDLKKIFFNYSILGLYFFWAELFEKRLMGQFKKKNYIDKKGFFKNFFKVIVFTPLEQN